jgi:hypothetical protein
MSVTRSTMQLVVTLAAVFVLLTTMLPVQPVFGSGAARRDAVHAEAQHRQDAITRAKDAVAHGQQGHAEAVVTNADAALQHALKAGEDAHLDAGITELKRAIEHGKAGHADVATKHAELAVTHLSEK